jgi:hypothetical protein
MDKTINNDGTSKPVQAVTLADPSQVGAVAAGAATRTLTIPIGSINIDPAFLVRAELNPVIAQDYAEARRAGAVFPLIHVFNVDGRVVLVDGRHRLEAERALGHSEVAVVMHVGTAKDAIWYSLGANSANGQRLNDTDKRAAVIRALKEFPTESQTQIARHVGCTQGYISKVAQDIPGNNLANPGRVRGKDGKAYPSKHKPKARKAPEAAEARDGTPDPDTDAAKATAGAVPHREAAPDSAPVGTEAGPGVQDPARTVTETLSDTPSPWQLAQWRKALRAMAEGRPWSWRHMIADLMREVAAELDVTTQNGQAGIAAPEMAVLVPAASAASVTDISKAPVRRGVQI